MHRAFAVIVPVRLVQQAEIELTLPAKLPQSARAPIRCQLSNVTDQVSGESDRRYLALLALRWLLGVVGLLAVMIGLASYFRAPLEHVGRAFVDRFGYVGMTLGTFIADGFHFPIPPQFYMLLAITSGVSQVAAFAAITLGSLAGGFAGYKFAARLAHIEVVRKRLEPSRVQAQQLFDRYGYLAAVLATFLPIPYSVLCYLSGLNGLPYRVFFVLSLCRIPRLVFFFFVIRFGWHL